MTAEESSMLTPPLSRISLEDLKLMRQDISEHIAGGTSLMQEDWERALRLVELELKRRGVK